MSAKVKCCVPGCDLKNPTSTHGIPDEEKEPFSRNIWIKALKLKSVKLTTYSRVCSHHFEPSDILPSNRLKRGTNPTRNLPVGYSLFFRQSLFTFLKKQCSSDYNLTNIIRQSLFIFLQSSRSHTSIWRIFYKKHDYHTETKKRGPVFKSYFFRDSV